MPSYNVIAFYQHYFVPTFIKYRTNLKIHKGYFLKEYKKNMVNFILADKGTNKFLRIRKLSAGSETHYVN